ncbi:hypothetical protein AVEN_243180-1 [Araneus ventricosus]|uniref:Uncharacterized protein n=1 Tax=Araneus ventricosus TaxID=182803 RepID=A0A4Y2JWF6_ARAVE|nr:hypothetical protein AVEN_243180-1 [Araneus ventricosus]
MRNLDIPRLRNGTRLQITNLGPNVMKATVMTDIGRRESVLIPRLPIIPKDLSSQFKRNPGSSDKSRGKPSLPDLSLHIVDMKGEERETVALGELLRVQVRMSDEDTYGIFVRNLVAKDGSGGNNLTLIDNTGCPVEENDEKSGP